jgi:Tfp pilus assembly protein PilO
MTLSPSRLWTSGAGLVAAVLVLLGWLLLISPQLDAAASSRREAQETTDSNDVLRTRLASLEADHTDLAGLQAALDTLHRQFPAGLELSDFVRRLAGFAGESGAAVQSVSRGEPVAREDGTAVWEVPVSLTVTGTHDQILGYVDRLQGVDDRLFLVTRLTLSPGDDDIMTGAVVGSTFVLPDAVAASTTDEGA